jgi:hypothetical protein
MPVYIGMLAQRGNSGLSHSFSFFYGTGVVNYSSFSFVNHNMVRIGKRDGLKEKEKVSRLCLSFLFSQRHYIMSQKVKRRGKDRKIFFYFLRVKAARFNPEKVDSQ